MGQKHATTYSKVNTFLNTLSNACPSLYCGFTWRRPAKNLYYFKLKAQCSHTIFPLADIFGVYIKTKKEDT